MVTIRSTFHRRCACVSSVSAILLACLSGAALAGNTDFLKNTAVGKFTKADTALMQKTLQDALDNAPDGQTVTWRNDKTGSSGSVTPGAAPEGREGCRQVRIENAHGQTRGSQDEVMCKVKGRWVVPDSRAAAR